MIRLLYPVIYVITSILQFFAIYAYFSLAHDMNGILSLILAVITCWIPILGTVLGVLGAHNGWGWSWFAVILLFFWPYILYMLIGKIRK